MSRSRACWAVHAPWVGGDTLDVHAASLDLHREKHVQALVEHGIYVREVARQDPGCLSGQELPPWSGMPGVARA
jgi:hypothetical protein